MDDVVIGRVRDVYDAHHARLWRSLYAFSGSRSVADEAAAEAFAQVLGRGADIRDVAGWVWRAAFAIARGQLQHMSRVGETDPADDNPVTRTFTDESLRQLLARLAALSETDREILVLCHVGGWRPVDLAPILGVSPVALRVRLHRATRRAREPLEPQTEVGDV